MSEVNLKRERFAQAIRQGQREQKMRQIRQKINRMAFSSNSYAFFNEPQFHTLKNKCRELNYRKECIEQMFSFLQNKSPVIFMECEDNINFLGEINEMFWSKKEIPNWQENICIRAKQIFKQYIQYILQMENNQNLTDSSRIPEATLASILTFMKRFSFYHELWHLITLSKSQPLLSMSFNYFITFVDINIEDLNSQEITSITMTLCNYRDSLYKWGGDIFTQIIVLVDSLCHKFLVKPDDMVRLVDVINSVIIQCPGNDKKLIKHISCETDILKNFLTYLDKRTDPKYRSFGLTTTIVDFINKIFTKSGNEVLQEIFTLHPQIVVFIRSWLPIEEKVSVQDLSHFANNSHDHFNKSNIRLCHSGNKCTKYLIFALTNIVVSGDIFFEEIVSKSDIWRVLIMLEGIVQEQCVEEIAFFIYNTVSMSSTQIIRVLIQQSLADVLLSLLKYQNYLILTKALQTIVLVWNKLVDSENQGTTPSNFRTWPYTKQMWRSGLQNKGGKILIERLLANSNHEVADLSAKAFDLFQ